MQHLVDNLDFGHVVRVKRRLVLPDHHKRQIVGIILSFLTMMKI